MSDWYCPLPFRHAYIDSSGVSACCQTRRHAVTLEQWTEHPYLKQLQQDILSGKIPNDCSGCVQQEQMQGRSLRTDSIADYNEKVSDTKIDFIDYRSSNICNFKCRSCNPMFSHGIAQEVRAHPQLEEFFLKLDTKTVSIDESYYQWIIAHLPQIKRLMFTGGEPTVIPGVRLVIEQILRNHADSINILITSNASFTDEFWYDITRKISNLHWTLSIDAVDNQAEIIRHGTDWPTVKNNAEWMAVNATSLDINTVVSNLNVLHLKPLLQFVRGLQLSSISPRGRHGDNGCRHQFFVCYGNDRLSAINWPDSLRPKVINYLTECLELDLDTEQETMVSGLLRRVVDFKFDPIAWERSQRLNVLLDQIRQEDHTLLFR